MWHWPGLSHDLGAIRCLDPLSQLSRSPPLLRVISYRSAKKDATGGRLILGRLVMRLKGKDCMGPRLWESTSASKSRKKGLGMLKM